MTAVSYCLNSDQHSSSIVNMDGKPTQFFIDLHDLMEREAADIDHTSIDQLKKGRQFRKNSELGFTSYTLESKLNDRISALISTKAEMVLRGDHPKSFLSPTPSKDSLLHLLPRRFASSGY